MSRPKIGTPPKPRRDANLIRLREKGYSLGQLAKIFHISRARVLKIIQDYTSKVEETLNQKLK